MNLIESIKRIRLMASEVIHLEQGQIQELGTQLNRVAAALKAHDHDRALELAGQTEEAYPDMPALYGRLRDCLAVFRWSWVLDAWATQEALCEVGGIASPAQVGEVPPHRAKAMLPALRLQQARVAEAATLFDEWLVSRMGLRCEA